MENSQALCRSSFARTINSEDNSESFSSTFAPGNVSGSLVQRCLAGDQQAWTDLLNSYRKLVYAVAARFGATRDDCADIFQSVCIELFNGLAQVCNEDSLRSWIITVTVRQAFRWKKGQAQHVPLDEAEVEPKMMLIPDFSHDLWRCQLQEMVRKGIDQLPARSAEMLRLLFLEQPPLPYEEVARRLGLATGSIGFLRGRALSKLKKILDHAGCGGG